MKKFLPQPLADFYQGLMLACGAGCLLWFAMLLVRFPSTWLIVLAWFGTIVVMAKAVRWTLRRQRAVTKPSWY
ncbi:MAG: hypothetical protein IT368_09690 [Candidatus Hydrogenedentes bacterium]|nr:hypothetical protein [Candidatus Hydrogenedentota bacterium]